MELRWIWRWWCIVNMTWNIIKKIFILISNRGKLDPLIPAMFGFPLLYVKNLANLALCCEKRIDFLLFRGKKKEENERDSNSKVLKVSFSFSPIINEMACVLMWCSSIPLKEKDTSCWSGINIYWSSKWTIMT